MKLHTATHPRGLTLGTGVFVALLLGIGWYTLQVGDIECRLDVQSCPPALQDALAPLRGRSLIGVDLREDAQQMVTAHSVRATSVQKKFPRLLTVQFAQVPISYRLNTAEKSWDVNSTGTVFEPSSAAYLEITTKLPVDQLMSSARLLKPEFHQALRAVAESDSTKQATQIELLDNETIIITMKEGIRALVPTQETALHLAELHQILTSSEYRTVSKDYQEIDVRFKLPVLRKKQ